jgi:hypothetical protein
MKKRIAALAMCAVVVFIGVTIEPGSAAAACTTRVTNPRDSYCPPPAKTYQCWRTGWPWARHTVCGWR